jgi:hypothetical protein
MEARQTLRGSGVPKGLVIVLAICAAFGIALAGSAIAKNFSSSSSTGTSTVHPAAGTVLRQDNPANGAFYPAPGTVLRQDNPPISGAPLLDRGADRGSAPAATHSSRSYGNTVLQNSDGPAFTAYDPGWDARSVREGFGA